jgi:hypothetical protein
LLGTSAYADSVRYLVFNAGSEETVIALEDMPVMTINDGVLKVVVRGEERLSASLSDGLTYRFSETLPTGIQEVFNDEAPRLEQGHVYMANARKGDIVRVFTVDGKFVTSQRVDDDGTADIDLTVLNKGLYIVKSARTSIKVINK